MDREITISRTEGWLAAWVGEELMMMSADSNAYLSLSKSGGRIWEVLETPCTVSGLCEALAADYAVEPSEIREEVLAFVERLRRQHAIQVHSSAVA
jgi:Coenzyme PQQ synthesis protein D (PqqD)